MTHALSGLEPQLLWDHFAALAAIPRGSKNEAAATAHVVAFAARLGLPAKVDSVGNVLITKAGTKGLETKPPVLLQGHLDMVCEKNSGTVHDFTKDPIRLVVAGDEVKADGTTLGADNGIGCAAALALLESKDIPHPPLECLFTIDEETGLTGANALTSDFLSATRMLNLDTEEEGAIYVGCAGGLDTMAATPVTRVAPAAGASPYRIAVTGLRGGHSGCDIHEGRVNALKVLARAVSEAETFGFAPSTLDGGSKRNAIAREGFASGWLDTTREADLRAALGKLEADVRSESGRFDNPVHIGIERVDAAPNPLAAGDAKRIVGFIHAAPHGVLGWSPDIPGLVQTSTNLAIVETKDDEVSFATSQRSSVDSAKKDAGRQMATAMMLAGLAVKQGDGYPGWKPNVSSPILGVAKSVHAEVFGHEPEVKAIHAGLECGIIGEKFPGMDTISFGPTIRNAHSPDECVSIPSVQNFWKYLTVLLPKM
ncbi:MAG: aminoacyl-histidine dipeptidase [Holophagales bacterium]|nr:aminoacyl-histidine dipeptidase [Holophagales bacterium]